MEPKINAAVAVPPAACRPPASSAHSSAAALYDAPHASYGHHRLLSSQTLGDARPSRLGRPPGPCMGGSLETASPLSHPAARHSQGWSQMRAAQGLLALLAAAALCAGRFPPHPPPPTHRCCQLPPEQVVTQ